MGNYKDFRDNGAVGALLDEYEKSIHVLKNQIRDISPSQLTKILDTNTLDKDCISIQSILTHVIRAGYTYSIEIRKHQGEHLDYRKKIFLPTVAAYMDALDLMFEYCESTFLNYPDIKLEEHDDKNKMKVSWGQYYDVEQLMEHAIVHILRHRRQIERFKVML